jgi:peptidoglycan/LPS O-acetylase OafA/YrhL
VVGDLRGGDKIGLWLRGSFPANWQFFCPGLLLAIAPHLTSPPWRRALVEVPVRRAALIAAVVTVAGAALLTSLAPVRWGVPAYQLMADVSRPLFAAGFGIVVAYAIAARPVQAKFVLHLGLVSYGIYLLHAVLTEVFHTETGRDFLPLAGTGGVPGFAVHFAYLAALTVIAASISWRWLERPLIGYSRVLGDRWTTRQGRAGTPPPATEVSRA